MGRSRDLEVRIRAIFEGSDRVVSNIEEVEAALAATRREIIEFARGGLNRLSVGSEAIEASATYANVLGLNLRDSHRELARLNAELLDTNRTRPFQEIQSDIVQTEAEIARLRHELSRLPRDLRESSLDTVGFLGDIDTNLATLSSSITGLGASSIGSFTGLQSGPAADLAGGLMIGSDFFAAAEAVPRLRQAAGVLRSNMDEYIAKSAAQATATSRLAASAQAATAPLGSTASGLAAMTAAALPFIATVGVIGGLALALSASNRQTDELIAAESARTEGMLERLRLERELEGLNREQIEARRLELQERRDALAEEREVYRLQKGQNIDNPFEGQGLLGDGVDQLLSFSNQFQDLLNGSEVSAGAAAARFDELTGEINRLDADLATYNNALRDATFREAFEAGATGAQLFIESMEAAGRAELDLSQTIRSASSEQVQERIAALNEENEAVARQVDGLNEEITRVREAMASATPGSEEAENLRGRMTDLQAALVDLDAAYTDNQTTVRRLTDEALPLIRAREREQESLDRLEEAARRRAEALEEMGREQAQAAARLEDLRASMRNIEDEESERLRLAAEERGITQIREAEMALLDERERAAIAARDAASREQERVTVLEESSARRAQIDQEFLEQEIERFQDFALKESRLAEDAGRQRLKILQDTERSLLKAVRDNDVRAFIEAQEQGSQQLSEFDSDTDLEARRRREDYELQVQEAREARQRELVVLQESTATRLQQITDAATQELTIEQRFAQERAALQERYAREDADRQERLRQEAFNSRLVALRREEELMLNEWSRATRAIFEAGAGAGRGLAQSLMAGFYQSAAVLGTLSGDADLMTSNRSRGITAYAEGGIPDERNHLALLNERPGWRDVVLPVREGNLREDLRDWGFELAETRPSQGRGSRAVSVSVTNDFRDMRVGEIATPDDITRAITRTEEQFIRGVEMAVRKVQS